MNIRKIIFIILFLILSCVLIFEIYIYWELIKHAIINFWFHIIKDRYEWAKLILTTTIGGAIGGLITYLYVIYRENIKENRAIKREHDKDELDKKEKISTALLNTQMSISFQMCELNGIEEIFLSIINFHIFGDTLLKHFQDIENTSGKTNKLLELFNSNKNFYNQDILQLTTHLIIPSPTNTIIVLPHEIFNLSTITIFGEKLPVDKLAHYFQELASCNRTYTQIISLIKHHNEIRNIILNQPISKGETGIKTDITQQGEFYKMLSIVSARFELASKLIKEIANYLKTANKIFTEAGNYIEQLGIVPSIKAERDNNGKIIFEKNK